MHFQHIGIIGKNQNPCVSKTVVKIFKFLEQYSTIYLEENTFHSFDKCLKVFSLLEISNFCDLAIIVGGDGNFLSIGKKLSLMNNNLPIIGINRGKLGFLTDIYPDDIEVKLLSILKGKYIKCKRLMLEARVKHKNCKFFGKKDTAFNDIVITSEGCSRLFLMSVYINNKYAFDQRSDGIIISTPTGSTAHALSAGGPIVYPKTNVITLVPMYPQSLNSRPIVIDSRSKLIIVISRYNNPSLKLSFDGHKKIDLKSEDKIYFKRSDKSVTIVHPEDYNYFHSLRSKLHWNKMLFD